MSESLGSSVYPDCISDDSLNNDMSQFISLSLRHWSNRGSRWYGGVFGGAMARGLPCSAKCQQCFVGEVCAAGSMLCLL